MIFNNVTNEQLKRYVTDLDIAEAMEAWTFERNTFTDQTACQNFLDNYSADYSNHTSYELCVQMSYSNDAILGGGQWKIFGHKTTSDYETQIAIQYKTNSFVIKGRSKFGGTWGTFGTLATTADLANYLPKSGGEIDGNVSLISNQAVTRSISVINSKRAIYSQVLSDGSYRFRDDTNAKDIISSTANGTNTFNGTASGNLPLSGGTVGDGTKIEPLKIKGTTNVLLGMYNSSGSALGYFGVNASKKPIYQGSDNVGRELHHDGNSAKVVVSETPLTAEGSVRIW